MRKITLVIVFLTAGYFCLGGSLCLGLMGEPQGGCLRPPGDFFLAEVSQSKNTDYIMCSQEGLFQPKGWLRRESYVLLEGAPRPSVVGIRRHLKRCMEALGGMVVFEGRCAPMDSTADLRANDVILTGLIPTPWGNLYLEVWPWEQGESVNCQVTFILEDL
ncbi:MAG: hypothetical protein WHX93_16475 [bacterium]